MQGMRKEWIREGRAKQMLEVEDEERGLPYSTQKSNEGAANKTRDQDAAAPKSSEVHLGLGSGRVAEASGSKHQRSNGNEANAESLFLSDGEQEIHDDLDDDLDAIMAEDDARQAASTVHMSGMKSTSPKEDDFADEEEAMRDMEDLW